MAFQRRQYGACWKFANDALNETPDNADALCLTFAAPVMPRDMRVKLSAEGVHMCHTEYDPLNG